MAANIKNGDLFLVNAWCFTKSKSLIKMDKTNNNNMIEKEAVIWASGECAKISAGLNKEIRNEFKGSLFTKYFFI